MKRTAYSALLCVLAASAACSSVDGNDEEGVGSSAQELTYTGVGPLTKKSFSELNEANRQANTSAYYAAVQVSSNGATNIGSIAEKLKTLQEFKSVYGFGSADKVAHYYNRGDLGIGREMHCVDRLDSTGQIACYVRNFSAGDEASEFRFGMSQDIAFKNMDASNAFATVAMVFRKNVQTHKVFFVVYGADEKLASAAPLDRHGLNFALGKRDSNGLLGDPGVHFNNHIPSNCLNCHGGTYNSSTKLVEGAQFLPFDLDAFEYQSTRADRSRDFQAPAFKALNQIVKRVASSAGGTGAEVVAQIDGWYASGNFNSAYVPPGWQGSSADSAVYTNVVRGACRGCHMTSPLSFSGADVFPADLVAQDLCNLTMPHALQNVREFWQSTKPLALENYFRAKGQTTAANNLQACGPKRVVTLDPHRLNATTSVMF